MKNAVFYTYFACDVKQIIIFRKVNKPPNNKRCKQAGVRTYSAGPRLFQESSAKYAKTIKLFNFEMLDIMKCMLSIKVSF